MEPRSKRPIDGAILNQAKEDQMQKHSILQVYIVQGLDPITSRIFIMSDYQKWTLEHIISLFYLM